MTADPFFACAWRPICRSIPPHDQIAPDAVARRKADLIEPASAERSPNVGENEAVGYACAGTLSHSAVSDKIGSRLLQGAATLPAFASPRENVDDRLFAALAAARLVRASRSLCQFIATETTKQREVIMLASSVTNPLLVPPAPKVLKAIRAEIKKRKFTPQGIEHHYALLGSVRPGPEWKVDRFRHEFSSVMKRGSKK